MSGNPPERMNKKYVFIPIYVGFDGSEKSLIGFEGVQKTSGDTERSILSRVARGKNIIGDRSDKDKFLFFSESEQVEKFENVSHKHSEQHFFEFLSCLPVEKFMETLKSKDPNIKAGTKVYMISYDMISDRTSCNACKLSEIAEMNVGSSVPPNTFVSFASRLQEHLKEEGYRIPKDGKIKVATRIMAGMQNMSSPHNHRNLSEKNAKYLGNLGIFEYVAPITFVSGSERNLTNNRFELKRKFDAR